MKDESGAAFPRPAAWSPGYEPSCVPGQQGLTKREYFAGLAMQGMLAGPLDKTQGNPAMLAEWAVQNADALLAALKEQS